MDYCLTCGKELRRDDVGFYKKMVNRGANEFVCIECLSEYYGITPEKAREMIERFREQGCTSFT